MVRSSSCILVINTQNTQTGSLLIVSIIITLVITSEYLPLFAFNRTSFPCGKKVQFGVQCYNKRLCFVRAHKYILTHSQKYISKREKMYLRRYFGRVKQLILQLILKQRIKRNVIVSYVILSHHKVNYPIATHDSITRPITHSVLFILDKFISVPQS